VAKFPILSIISNGKFILAIPEYYIDNEQANIYLRLMLALLGKHKISPNLINISLCYEYVTAANLDLQHAMDRLFESNSYDKTQAKKLYKQYIWDDEKRIHEKLNKVLKQHFSVLLSTLNDTSSKTSISSKLLEQKANELQSESSINKVEEIIESIVSESKNVVKINHSFEDKLKQQKSELEKLKSELKEVKKLAETDPLTKLNNRRTLEKAMKHNIALVPKTKEPLSLLMLDIDHFKLVNDKYGHIIGDKVICFIAKTLLDNFKRKDTSARIGGEEFAVLLPDTQMDDAVILAEQLRKIIAKSRLRLANSQEKIDAVTISIGVASYHLGEASEEFIKRADRALYTSKKTGRNRVTALKT